MLELVPTKIQWWNWFGGKESPLGLVNCLVNVRTDASHKSFKKHLCQKTDCQFSGVNKWQNSEEKITKNRGRDGVKIVRAEMSNKKLGICL